jgi:hypothetical protein
LTIRTVFPFNCAKSYVSPPGSSALSEWKSDSLDIVENPRIEMDMWDEKTLVCGFAIRQNLAIGSCLVLTNQRKVGGERSCVILRNELYIYF